MNESVVLSIIIVTFNSEKFIESCLDSIFSQNNAPFFEVIIVDNASTDKTCELIRKKFAQVRLFSETTNLGFGNANNRAFSEAKGTYIVLLNPDAQLQKNTLASAYHHMLNHSNAGMAGGLLLDRHGNLQPSARQFPSILNEMLTLTGLAARYPRSRFFGRFDRTWADPYQSAVVDWVPGAFAILPHRLLDKIGFFDSRFFLYYEEVDLCRRIKKAGFKIYYWPDLKINHIGGASSETVDGLEVSNAGKQLTSWRMRSQLLYYRKWHGWLATWGVKKIEEIWHWIRMMKNRFGDPAKSSDSQRILDLWPQAWKDTAAGKTSPKQPW